MPDETSLTPQINPAPSAATSVALDIIGLTNLFPRYEVLGTALDGLPIRQPQLRTHRPGRGVDNDEADAAAGAAKPTPVGIHPK